MGVLHGSIARASGTRESSDLVLRTLRTALGDELRGRRVAVWGLGTSSPSGSLGRVSGVRLVEQLLDAGAAVSAYDPSGVDDARERIGDRALLLEDGYLAAVEAEALVLTSTWPRERRPDFERLRACMARPFLIDASAAFEGLGLVGFRFGGALGAFGLGLSGLLTRPGDA